jgi:hypothetical protein
MENAAYFRHKAEQCFRLIHAVNDVDVIDELNALGREFRAKAEALERQTSGALRAIQLTADG